MRFKLLIAHLTLILIFSSIAIADKSFTSAGVKIAYNVQGDGPTVVLIHGLTGSQKEFIPLAKSFADIGFRAIVFDVRGHGASDKPHNPKAYGEQIFNDIRNLLDHLSIESAHVSLALAFHFEKG
jgi:pimeloyl-ACP methyl ester carboxylesterase